MIKNAYEKKSVFEVIFDKRHSHQCVIRKQEIDNDVNKTQLMLEMEVVGVKPDHFVYLLQNITETQLSWNEHCKKCLQLQSDDGSENSTDIFVTFVKSPGPFIAGRVFIDGRYMFKDQNNGHQTVIFSSKGNESIVQEYTSKNNLEGSVMAYCVISGHYYMPLLNIDSQVIGTKVFYLNQSDFGGKVPQWITRKFAPRAIYDTYISLIKAAKNIP